MGGVNARVDVDETKIGGYRNYNRGRLLGGVQYSFGGFDTMTKEIFMVPVTDR